MVSLNEDCSATIQNALHPKLKVQVCFVIPIHIGMLRVEKALCDLVASISLMPYSLCKELGMTNLTPTTISLRLVDSSARFSKGIFRNCTH